ncbi:hypothetical protein [Collimonas sp.]|uniref:hypothetical protein n=1 Tax=Collimonas sp. TaxID=1963772 RepID=UPI0037BEEB90
MAGWQSALRYLEVGTVGDGLLHQRIELRIAIHLPPSRFWPGDLNAGTQRLAGREFAGVVQFRLRINAGKIRTGAQQKRQPAYQREFGRAGAKEEGVEAHDAPKYDCNEIGLKDELVTVPHACLNPGYRGQRRYVRITAKCQQCWHFAQPEEITRVCVTSDQ